MVDPIQLPEFPPAGPWSAYVLLVIWMPMIFRLLFLIVPFRKAISRLAPHSTWAIRALKDLPIKGLGLLVANEIIAFLIPPFVVLCLRLFINPIGWQTWDDVSSLGLFALAMLVICWLCLDFLRILRVRKMLKALEKHDIERIQKFANVGLKTRKLLRKFSGKDDGKKNDALEHTSSIASSSAKRWGRRILLTRKLTPAGLLGSVALSASVELAKHGAGKISDAVDQRLQKEFENIAKTNTKTLLLLFMRDLAMGIVPLVFLAVLPRIL